MKIQTSKSKIYFQYFKNKNTSIELNYIFRTVLFIYVTKQLILFQRNNKSWRLKNDFGLNEK